MASLQVRNGRYRVLFCHRGKLHSLGLGPVTEAEARAKAAQADYLLMRLKQGLLTLPPGTDIVTFVHHDGNPPAALSVLPDAPRRAVTLADLRDRYLATHANGTVEANTLATCRLHLAHATRLLGAGLKLTDLGLPALQGYVNARGGAGIAPITIRKELATLRAAWNWGGPMGLTAGPFPAAGLRYPKADEKLPFMTLAEARRRVEAGSDPYTVWEAVYLTAADVAALLTHVREAAAHPWVFPLVAFAAHTGARRSELLRATVADVDLAANVVTIREKKRVRGQRTTRRVPLTPDLRAVLEGWLADHPGGTALFCHAGTVARSRKRSRTTGHAGAAGRPTTVKGRMSRVRQRAGIPAQAPLTKDEVHDHFRRVLRGTAWEPVRGLHTLRHSFVSACATAGVDQRLVEEWAGHMSPDISRRYRHLYPSAQQAAIKGVFGQAGRGKSPSRRNRNSSA